MDMSMRKDFQRMPWWAPVAVLMLSGCGATDAPRRPDPPAEAKLDADEQVLLKSAAEIEQRLTDERAVYRDAALQAYVQSIADRLLEAGATTRGLQVRARVLESQTPDAFVLRNGALFISRGLLSYCANEAQLATVMGRELIHFANRDELKERRAERSHVARNIVPGLVLITVTAGLATPALIGWTDKVVDGLTQELELQADREVVDMLIAAGYRVDEAPAAFNALRAQKAEGVPEQSKLTRDASLATRANSLAQLIDAVPEPGRHSGDDGRAAFAAKLRPTLLRMADDAFRKPDYQQARAVLARYERAFGPSGRVHFMRAQIAVYSGSGYSGDDAALAAYQAAGAFPDVPAEAFREMGLIYRRRGASGAAQTAFKEYLRRQPTAGDVAIIRKYLEN
jgi:predicted Zn-dependent protease